MAFSEANLLRMLAALPTATLATVAGESFTVDFRLAARDVTLYGGVVESTSPYCRVTPGQIAAFGLAHETVLTLNGTDYQVIAMNEEQSGFVKILLNTDIPLTTTTTTPAPMTTTTTTVSP